ncbi:uncharacterized protein [Lolium perenne]|uniref:uncharacterized protein n=1 Tax=Lolium perenne TaxID=4522 RepID=UPI003A99E02A
MEAGVRRDGGCGGCRAEREDVRERWPAAACAASWNIILALHVRRKDWRECMEVFDAMVAAGDAAPNEKTFVSVGLRWPGRPREGEVGSRKALHKQTQIEKNEHLIRLNAAIDICRYLLHQGQPFRGHDESEDSTNKGNYLELKDYTMMQNDVVAKAFKNAPRNNQLVSPTIQKDITQCFAEEIMGSILKDIDNGVFSLLVDECRDVSDKEQMAVVLRYVNKCGVSNERFVGVVHVEETTADYLKSTIDFMFAKFGLSLQQVRGQGYDGASNMAGEFNGLQAKIMRENSSAYYVHCFAHKLNLVVVSLAKKITDVGEFFDMISLLVTVAGYSCKRKDKLREYHQEEVRKAICRGELSTGSGLNQEMSLQRPGDTRWNSHYTTLLSLSKMFPSVVKILEYVEEDGKDPYKKRQANGLLKYFQTFDSVFFLHMMMIIFAWTNGLSKTFQTKDMDMA